MNSKFLLAVAATTVVGFFGGWLVFGMAMDGYYQANSTEAAIALHKADEDMIWWAVILGQVAWAFLITWIVDKTGSTSAAKGAVTGAIVMGLIALNMDLFFYAMMDMFQGPGIIIVDVLVNAVFGAFVAAVAGWILGRGE